MLAIGPLATAGVSAKVMVASVGEIDHQQAVMVVIGNSELSWGYRRHSATGIGANQDVEAVDGNLIDGGKRIDSIRKIAGGLLWLLQRKPFARFGLYASNRNVCAGDKRPIGQISGYGQALLDIGGQDSHPVYLAALDSLQ